MDTIDTFLNAMFAPYPATPRLLEAKAELRAMMEDAYADAIASGRSQNEAVGQVITDFGNLDELAEGLGIAGDLRSGTSAGNAAADVGDAGAPGPSAPGSSTPDPSTLGSSAPGPSTQPFTAPVPPVTDFPAADGFPDANARPTPAPGPPEITLDEAQALADARKRAGKLLGSAVALFVIAPAPIVILASLGSTGVDAFIGLVTTVGLVACGVAILIHRSREFAQLERVIDGQFTPSPTVTEWARRLRDDNRAEYTRRLATAITIWICAIIPAAGIPMFSDGTSGTDGAAESFGVAITLVMVAAGLRVFLPATWASSTYRDLADGGTEYGQMGWHPGAARGRSDDDPFVDFVAAIWWPACIVIYFVWSFVFDAWAISWIIWPVSGVLFGAFAAGRDSWRDYRRAQRR